MPLQRPLPPPGHHQTSTSTSCGPHPGGDSGVVAWAGGRGHVGTRLIKRVLNWVRMRAGVFLFVFVCGCVVWGFFSQMW